MNNPIVFAAIGGLAVVALHLLELPRIPKQERPDIRDVVYWIPYVLSPLLGAFMAWVYVSSGTELKPILAVNIGVSAPLILRSMAAANPFGSDKINPGAGA